MRRVIVADENIPAVTEAFGGFGEVRLVDGRQLEAAQLRDADTLLVRSVTRVNAALLATSQVRFVGSATIGTDHLDKAWLEARGIRWCNAPGSNAAAVVDYCLSALCRVPGKLEQMLAGGVVGIIGFGNVGSRLYQRLTALGIRCRVYDPFLGPEHCPDITTLDKLLSCDMLSLHTPLTQAGPYPTYHMLSLEQLSGLPSHALLLNAGRGEVLAGETLKALALQRPDIAMVLDVWEGEPAIDPALMALTRLATPHIAGYSQEGKVNGLLQVLEHYADFIGVPAPVLSLEGIQGAAPLVALGEEQGADLIRKLVLGSYDIAADDRRLRELDADALAAGFDYLRRHYPVRRELSSCRVYGQPSAGQQRVLAALGMARS